MHSPWRLDGRRATLQLGSLAAGVDLDRPERGLDELTVAGAAIERARIMGVELPADQTARDRFVDAYVRGNDLIANYAEVSQPSLRWQIYWRVSSERFPGALAAVEAIVSVHTGLLESRPELALRSALPGDGAVCWRKMANGGLETGVIDAPARDARASAHHQWTCFGFRLPDGLAYVEMVHPDDFTASSVLLEQNPSASGSVRHRLFGDRLEKGVILRSRVLGLFLPGLPTTAAIETFKQMLMDEALPLTT
jgi:hypothetical protein